MSWNIFENDSCKQFSDSYSRRVVSKHLTSKLLSLRVNQSMPIKCCVRDTMNSIALPTKGVWYSDFTSELFRSPLLSYFKMILTLICCCSPCSIQFYKQVNSKFENWIEKWFEMASSQMEPSKLSLSNKRTIENELDPKIFKIQKKWNYNLKNGRGRLLLHTTFKWNQGHKISFNCQLVRIAP
jgi:hypothetical protein